MAKPSRKISCELIGDFRSTNPQSNNDDRESFSIRGGLGHEMEDDAVSKAGQYCHAKGQKLVIVPTKERT